MTGQTQRQLDERRAPAAGRAGREIRAARPRAGGPVRRRGPPPRPGGRPGLRRRPGHRLRLARPRFRGPGRAGHLAYVRFVAAPRRAAQPARPRAGPDRPRPLAAGRPPAPPVLRPGRRPAAPRRRRRAGGVDATPAPNPDHAWNGGAGGTDLPLFEHPAGPAPAPPDAVPFRLLRLLSVASGVATVGAVLALSARYLSGRWALLPAVFVATLPQFLFVSATIGNDALTGLLVTVCLLLALSLLDGRLRGRSYLLLGVCLGLALLTKKTALFLLPGLALLLGYAAAARPDGRQRARAAAWTAALLATLALVSGWYFLRSQALYGDPLATAMEKATLGARCRRRR